MIDTAGGSGTLTVADVGTGKSAADLHLRRRRRDVNARIDGTTTFTIDLDADDTLDDLVAKINELGAGASASVCQ